MSAPARGAAPHAKRPRAREIPWRFVTWYGNFGVFVFHCHPQQSLSGPLALLPPATPSPNISPQLGENSYLQNPSLLFVLGFVFEEKSAELNCAIEAMEPDHNSENFPLSAATYMPTTNPQDSTSNVSEEHVWTSCQRSSKDYPDLFKFASSSQPVASSSTTSAPLRRESTEIIPPDPPKEKQVTPAELAKLGIKVRDFAYECVLPPIPPYIRGRAQVIVGRVPAPRLQPNENEEDSDPFRAGPSQPKASFSKKPASQNRGRGKARSVERESTEPDDSQLPPPSRERGYVDILTEYQPAFQSQPDAHSPRTPPALAPLYTNSQSQSIWAPEYSSQSQSIPSFAYSQESNYIDTPLVTPNGSLQWPEPEIGSAPISQMDTDSQLPAVELLSYSQLGFTPIESQMESPSQSSMPPPLIRSSSSPLSAPPSSPLPTVALAPEVRQRHSVGRAISSPSPTRPSRSRSPRRRRRDESPASSPLSDLLPSPQPRYNLRKRRAASPEAQPSARRATRSQSRQPQSQPPPARPPIFSRQSMQAKGKSQQNSKTTKPIRKPRVPGRGRDETMIMG